MVSAGQIDPNTGFGPIVWDSWETNWTGIDVINNTRNRTETQGGEWRGVLGEEEEELHLAQEQPLRLERKFVKQFKEELNLELELHCCY